MAKRKKDVIEEIYRRMHGKSMPKRNYSTLPASKLPSIPKGHTRKLRDKTVGRIENAMTRGGG